MSEGDINFINYATQNTVQLIKKEEKRKNVLRLE